MFQSLEAIVTAINDPRISLADVQVLVYIVRAPRNAPDGFAASLMELAHAVGRDKANTVRSLRALERNGHLVVYRRGGRFRNVYALPNR